MKALIVETGRARGALAAARALHRAGWTVGVGTPSSRGMAAASRATAHRHRIPPAGRSGDFIEAVNAAIHEQGYEVVFGCGDAELIALSSRRDEIEAVVPHAPHDRVMRAVDKSELPGLAEAAGLSVPPTFEATGAGLADHQPPYLVKASLHAPRARDGAPDRLEALVARDVETAERRAEQIRRAGSVPLIQTLVPGRLMAYTAAADRSGRIVAEVAQVADARWPPDVGVSARAETVAADPAVATAVARLLSELEWFGIAQLQFVLSDGGDAWLIDFNGRFYGSLALAVAAGANLPAIWAALATDRSPPEPAPIRVGLRYQWLEGDLRRALAERRGGLLRDLGETVRFSRGAVHAVAAPGDPRPSRRELAMVPLRIARRARS